MRILGLIPARGGSKGVLKKNIRLLGDKPLISYTAEVALKSKYLTKVIVSTDDDEIANVSERIGVNAPFIRPKHLAEDSSPTLPVILHALDFFERKKIFFDAVCLLQATSPFRTIEFLNESIKKFIKKDTDSLISVREVPHEFNPHWTFILDENKNLKISTGESSIISRRQELPKAYHRDGSIYITKTNVLKEKNSLYGDTISFIKSSKESYVNIDTLNDWNKAEQMLKKFNL